MKTSPGRKTFIVLNALFIILVCVAIMVPIWMVVVTSLSTDAVAAKEGFVLIPKGIEFESYHKNFVSRGYMGAFTRSVWITLAATAVSMILTTMLAYGLSQSGLMFRTTFNINKKAAEILEKYGQAEFNRHWLEYRNVTLPEVETERRRFF